VTKVLIVEDNFIQHILLSDYLQGLGYEVEVVENGLLFWGYLEAFAPDLIVMDLKIPEVSGFDLLEEMVRQGITIPVIVFSAYSFADDIQRALSLGVKQYIVKPADFEVIAEAIASLLANQK
jgi:two-component system, cell cycle response regulator DivK